MIDRGKELANLAELDNVAELANLANVSLLRSRWPNLVGQLFRLGQPESPSIDAVFDLVGQVGHMSTCAGGRDGTTGWYMQGKSEEVDIKTLREQGYAYMMRKVLYRKWPRASEQTHRAEYDDYVKRVETAYKAGEVDAMKRAFEALWAYVEGKE